MGPCIASLLILCYRATLQSRRFIIGHWIRKPRITTVEFVSSFTGMRQFIWDRDFGCIPITSGHFFFQYSARNLIIESQKNCKNFLVFHLRNFIQMTTWNEQSLSAAVAAVYKPNNMLLYKNKQTRSFCGSGSFSICFIIIWCFP